MHTLSQVVLSVTIFEKAVNRFGRPLTVDRSDMLSITTSGGYHPQLSWPYLEVVPQQW
jgi:hypothetical protein